MDAAGGGAGTALKPALEHDLAGGVHARGVHGGDGWRRRGGGRAAARRAVDGAGWRGGMGRRRRVAVGGGLGGADEADSGLRGDVDGVEGMAGEVVVVVGGGGRRRGEGEAGGGEGEGSLGVRAVAEERRRRRGEVRRSPAAVSLEEEQLEGPGCGRIGSSRRGRRHRRRRRLVRRRRGLDFPEPEQLPPAAGARGRLGGEHVRVERLRHGRRRRPERRRLHQLRRRCRRRMDLSRRLRRRGRLRPKREQLPVREQLVGGEHGGRPAKAELEVDELLGDLIRRGLAFRRLLGVAAEGEARAEPAVGHGGGGRGGGHGHASGDGGCHGARGGEAHPRWTETKGAAGSTRATVLGLWLWRRVGGRKCERDRDREGKGGNGPCIYNLARLFS